MLPPHDVAVMANVMEWLRGFFGYACASNLAKRQATFS